VLAVISENPGRLGFPELHGVIRIDEINIFLNVQVKGKKNGQPFCAFKIRRIQYPFDFGCYLHLLQLVVRFERPYDLGDDQQAGAQ